MPMVRKIQHNHRDADLSGEIRLFLADNGYASAFEALADLPLLVSVTSGAHQAGFRAKRRQAPAGQLAMAARLVPLTGKEHYRRRSRSSSRDSPSSSSASAAI